MSGDITKAEQHANAYFNEALRQGHPVSVEDALLYSVQQKDVPVIEKAALAETLSEMGTELNPEIIEKLTQGKEI